MIANRDGTMDHFLAIRKSVTVWITVATVGINRVIGIKTVFARYGDVTGTEDSGADYEIDDIMDLIPIIDKENGADRS